MKQSSNQKLLWIFILAFFSFSCSSNLDFNQVNDAKLEPVLLANLIYFDVPANQFITNGIELPVSQSESIIDIFKDNSFNTSLKRADLFFEVNNTINRAYILNIVMLDVNNFPLYAIQLNVPAYTGVENLVTKTEIFENTKLDLLKKTRKFAFTITMLAGPSLSETSLGSLKLRSSATAYLVL